MADSNLPDYNPWHPMTDPVALKTLGKMGEEVCELGSAISRCIIQGVDGKEPVTGKPNRLWLLEEMADVAANGQLVVELLAVTEDEYQFMLERMNSKIAKLREWHRMA